MNKLTNKALILSLVVLLVSVCAFVLMISPLVVAMKVNRLVLNTFYVTDLFLFVAGFSLVFIAFWSNQADWVIHKVALPAGCPLRPVAKIFDPENNLYRIFAFNNRERMVEYRVKTNRLTKGVLDFLETVPSLKDLKQVEFKKVTFPLSHDLLPHNIHQVTCLEFASVTPDIIPRKVGVVGQGCGSELGEEVRA